jgi:hypothetical protein
MLAAGLSAEGWPCQEYVDAEYIREAELVALVSPAGPDYRTLNIQQLYSSDLSREELLDFRFEYQIIDDGLWGDLAGSLAHNRPGFLGGLGHSRTIGVQGYDFCNFEVRLTPGVTYLLIHGDRLRYRSIEPVLDADDDQWVDFVLSVLD